jgi:hypothetical protein
MKKLPVLGDIAGMVASGSCLLHCLALPVLIAFFPALGTHGDDLFHKVMIALVLLAGWAGLAPGFRVHGKPLIPALGLLGVICLASAVFVVGPRYGEVAETIISVMGALFLLTAHIRNYSCCKTCRNALRSRNTIAAKRTG